MPGQIPIARRLSLGTWMAVVGTLLAVSGAVTAGYSCIFATKAELLAIELKQADTGDQRLNEWRLQTLEVQVQNLQARNERMDNHIVTLMERFRLTVEPPPVYKPLPEPLKNSGKTKP